MSAANGCPELGWSCWQKKAGWLYTKHEDGLYEYEEMGPYEAIEMARKKRFAPSLSFVSLSWGSPPACNGNGSSCARGCTAPTAPRTRARARRTAR